jgi:hypothetical protein
MVVVVAALGASALLACTTGSTADPWIGVPTPPTAAPPVGVDGARSSSAPLAREPNDVLELFATRILPTCSLNGGVCHNSNNYPDLRNVAALEDLVDLPCGRNAALELPDACEPAGDHLVAQGGVDVVVERASFDGATGVATITSGADVPNGPLEGVEMRRGIDDRVLDASAAGVTFVAVDARTIIAAVAKATPEARTFFEPKLPLREDRIWPADMNGNGVAGATSGWREIVPGRPERSYLVARLWDAELEAELMPRQCRTWDDSATRALACWIQNLRSNENGTPSNFYDPIDYAKCTFVVPRAGRCGTGLENGP